MMGYLWYTRYLLLTISIDKDKDTYMYIDSTHMVHADRKSYSRIFVTMERDTIINVLKKLGFITTSSIEIEVVSNRERFPKYT